MIDNKKDEKDLEAEETELFRTTRKYRPIERLNYDALEKKVLEDYRQGKKSTNTEKLDRSE